jgi:hypothetical protein
MVWSPQQRAWTTSFTVPAKLLPLHLALVFYHPGEQQPGSVHAMLSQASACALCRFRGLTGQGVVLAWL